MERKTLKPKPLFRPQPKALDGSKFVPTCHHCGVIGHIRPQYPKLKREQNHVTRSLSKKPSRPKHIVCHHCDVFDHFRPHCSKFQALKRIKIKEKLELFRSCAMRAKPVFGENSKLLKKEQNQVGRSIPKKPSEPKHIVCHHCGAFGHLRLHCFKFQTFKRIRRK